MNETRKYALIVIDPLANPENEMPANDVINNLENNQEVNQEVNEANEEEGNGIRADGTISARVHSDEWHALMQEHYNFNTTLQFDIINENKIQILTPFNNNVE